MCVSPLSASVPAGVLIFEPAEKSLVTAIACYKLHVHPQQKTYWILGIYLECIFGEHHMVFLQTLVSGKQLGSPYFKIFAPNSHHFRLTLTKNYKQC